MLSRLFSIFILTAYLAGSLGLKINQHFCCGKLVRSEILLGQTPSNCSGEPITKKSKCCSNQEKILKVDDGKQFSKTCIHHHSPAQPATISALYQLYDVRGKTIEAPQASPKRPPPNLAGGAPYYLRYHKLLI